MKKFHPVFLYDWIEYKLIIIVPLLISLLLVLNSLCLPVSSTISISSSQFCFFPLGKASQFLLLLFFFLLPSNFSPPPPAPHPLYYILCPSLVGSMWCNHENHLILISSISLSYIFYIQHTNAFCYLSLFITKVSTYFSIYPRMELSKYCSENFPLKKYTETSPS